MSQNMYPLNRYGWCLTPRQEEIVGLLSLGLTNQEIAREIFLAEGTIKFHLAQAYVVMGAKTRVDAARYGLGLPVLRREPTNIPQKGDDKQAPNGQSDGHG